MGHVATTIITAQMMAPTNGRMIQNAPTVSAAMNPTPSTVRTRS